LSDQTEKPKGALPKGYDANTPSTENTSSTEVVKQKKINFLELVRYTSTDQDQREKDLKEYETSYITRLEKNKPEESSDDFRVELGVSTESDDDLGKLNLRKHAVTKREELQEERLAYEQKYLDRYAEPKIQKKKASSSLYKPEKPKPKRDMKKERKKYEQKYLSRYKQPKSGVKKSTSWTQHDVALGRLTLSPHFNAKRRAKQDEIKEYEQKYLSRYKQPKPQKRTSSDLYKPEIPKPKTDRRKERKEYEQKYLSRYKEPKSTIKKSTSWTQHDVALGRLTLSPHFNAKRRAKQGEIREYEKQYLSRYKQPKSGVKKSSDLKHDADLGTLTLSQYVNAKRKAKQDEIREYEKQYLSRYKEPKPKKRAIQLEWEPEPKPKPKRDIRKERKDYERKYVSKFTQLQKTKLKIAALEQKLRLSQIELEEPKTDRKKERKEYEQKYLSRYKQPKSGVKKSTSWTQHDVALGRLTLSPHFNAKRKTKQDEIKKYEQKYLSRYKQPKTQKKKVSSSLYKPEIPKPKRDMKKERKEYEQKYLARHLKQRKTKPKKKNNSI